MRLLILMLAPFLFAFGVLVGFFGTPLFPQPVTTEDDLQPVNRTLMRMIAKELAWY